MNSRTSSRVGLRRAAAVVVAGLMLLTTGCIRMPEGGPVVSTHSRGSVVAEPPIYIDPRPPQKGASSPDIVKGFLDAMTATPIQTNVAKEYLTKDAQSVWNPERQTITYADTPSPTGLTYVTVALAGAHRYDARGAWRGSLPPGRNVLNFPMEQVDGEWRISRAPDALIVPESWFEQRFRPVSLFFFDPTARILVPEPVFVPRGEQLATTLVNGLLRGPGRSLTQVSRSFLPPGLSLGLSVPVSDDGVADISLKGDVGKQTPQALELMLAQLAWTLRQEPTIRKFRVTLGGEPVSLPGGVSVFDVDKGEAYDPAGFQASPLLFGLRAGRLVAGGPDTLAAVDGPLGATDYGVSAASVNIRATRVAAVAGRGRSLLEAPVRGPQGQGVHQIVSGASRLLRPAWDFSDRLWLVDDTAAGARVSFVEGTHAQGLRVPGVSGQHVRRFLVSRDGSRLVAVVHRPGGDALMVSRLLHDDHGRVLRSTRAHRIGWEGSGSLDIRDIAWQTPTTIAVLDEITPELAQVRTISVDGSPLGLDALTYTLNGRVRSLAGSAVRSEPLYAVANTSLYDLTNADQGLTTLDAPVSTLDYAG